MKQTLFIIMLVVFGLMSTDTVRAIDKESDGAAELSVHKYTGKDARVTKLESYLRSHNSPLVDAAEHFVKEADRLRLDWKLVAAIAGTESTFGKHIPPGSYNGWGWAVFTGKQSGAAFDNWEDGITTVSEGLRYNYVDKGATTIEAMGRRYAASPHWSTSVNYFLQKIDAFEPNTAEALAVNL